MTKRKPKRLHKKSGRPTKITSEVVKILEDCFEIDCTIEEACRQARISKQAYYDALKRNPKFADEMSRAQDWPLVAAKERLFKSIRSDPEAGALALKFLERRQKDRYTPKLIQEHQGEVAVSYAELEGKPKAKSVEEARQLAEEAGWDDPQ